MGMRCVALDVETTGLSPGQDRIVEFCFAELTPELSVEQVWTDRVNPGKPIPREAEQVHGISATDVEHKPGFNRFAAGVQQFLDDAVIMAYNAAFDTRFLHHELRRCGEPGLAKDASVIDPYHVFAEHFDTTYTLEDAYQHITGERHDAAHSAMGDVDAMLTVARHQLHRLDADLSMLAVHRAQLC